MAVKSLNEWSSALSPHQRSFTRKKNESIFGDTDSVEVIFDDIIVAAADEQEHAQIMVKLLQRAQEANVKFNTANFSTKSVKSSTWETSCLNQD